MKLPADQTIRRAQIALALFGVVLVVIGAMTYYGNDDTTTTPAAPTSSTPTTQAPTPTSTTTTAPPASSSTTPPAAPARNHDEDIAADEAKELREATDGAPQRAETVMKLLAQAPELGRDVWWEKTRGHLSEQGRAEMVSIDPEQVPFSEVTGDVHPVMPSTLEADDQAQGHGLEEITVIVPTNVGNWSVLLSLNPQNQTWKVASLQAPEGVN